MNPLLGASAFTREDESTVTSCLLEIGEHKIKVVVISNRYQCADPVFFEQFGLDIGKAALSA